ncbi:MAG: hypothetical protein WD904_01865 [Dehalococcoidia bacterium]
MGFLNDGWRDIIALAGIGATAVALIVAVWQIRSAADTVAKRAETVYATTRQLARQLQLTDLTNAVRIITNLQEHVRNRQYGAALGRMSDLREALAKLAGAGIPADDTQTFNSHIEQVEDMEKLLLKATLGESHPKDSQLTSVHVSLTQLSSFLTALSTRMQFDARQA